MSPVCVRSVARRSTLARPKSVTQTLPSGVQQQVRRLDVAVEDALAVGVGQGLGHLDADPRHALPVSRPFGDAVEPRPRHRAEAQERPTDGESGGRVRPAAARPARDPRPSPVLGASSDRPVAAVEPAGQERAGPTSAADGRRLASGSRPPRPRPDGPAAALQPPQLVEDLVQAQPVDELHGRSSACPSCSPTPKTGTMLVWCSRAAARASRSNRSRLLGVAEQAVGGRTFRATRRPSESCSAS